MPSSHSLQTVRAAAKPAGLLLALTPLAAAVGWIAFSRLAVNHREPLPPALPGKRFDLDTGSGRLTVYADGPEEGVPLLLVHSINAAASAYEVRPLYLRYRGSRPVYAVELPGFGYSERQERIYTPRLMTDALLAVTDAIRREHPGQPVDVLALSLSGEYAARAAMEHPELYRSLGLISPTGFDKNLAGSGRAQSTKGSAMRLALASVPVWSRALFDAVVTRPSMRFFLEKTWGSKGIDEGLLDYGWLSAHQPGAEHAVWSFLAGFLFADDISRIYRVLQLPVWSVHGQRGDFTDFRHEHEFMNRPNWTFDRFDTGAFPHFEALDEVTRSYDAFIGRLD